MHWNTSQYPDVEYAEVLESMYLPASSRVGSERLLDVSKLKYHYRWGDMDAGIAEEQRGANFLRSESIAIYPDTTVWKKDFHFTYNEPLFEQ